VRFFLIYGQYRIKLNFTWEKLAETSQKLDAFKHMVQDIETVEAAGSSEKAKKLAARIVPGFEVHMDDDLGVKAAFDEVFSVVSALHELKEPGRLGSEDAKAAVANLRKVDSVLQVIF
jgi:cysteinyl-tRNA synthetase